MRNLTRDFEKLLGTYQQVQKMNETRPGEFPLGRNSWKVGASCFCCNLDFSWNVRKHHCRGCGQIFCDACTRWKKQGIRVCKKCVLPVFCERNPVVSDFAGEFNDLMDHIKDLLKKSQRIDDLVAAQPSQAEFPLEKSKWTPDGSFEECQFCEEQFTVFKRKHHCRCCGLVFCRSCCNWSEAGNRICELCIVGKFKTNQEPGFTPAKQRYKTKSYSPRPSPIEDKKLKRAQSSDPVMSSDYSRKRKTRKVYADRYDTYDHSERDQGHNAHSRITQSGNDVYRRSTRERQQEREYRRRSEEKRRRHQYEQKLEDDARNRRSYSKEGRRHTGGHGREPDFSRSPSTKLPWEQRFERKERKIRAESLKIPGERNYTAYETVSSSSEETNAEWRDFS